MNIKEIKEVASEAIMLYNGIDLEDRQFHEYSAEKKNDYFRDFGFFVHIVRYLEAKQNGTLNTMQENPTEAFKFDL